MSSPDNKDADDALNQAQAPVSGQNSISVEALSDLNFNELLDLSNASASSAKTVAAQTPEQQSRVPLPVDSGVATTLPANRTRQRTGTNRDQNVKTDDNPDKIPDPQSVLPNSTTAAAAQLSQTKSATAASASDVDDTASVKLTGVGSTASKPDATVQPQHEGGGIKISSTSPAPQGDEINIGPTSSVFPANETVNSNGSTSNTAAASAPSAGHGQTLDATNTAKAVPATSVFVGQTLETTNTVKAVPAVSMFGRPVRPFSFATGNETKSASAQPTLTANAGILDNAPILSSVGPTSSSPPDAIANAIADAVAKATAAAERKLELRLQEMKTENDATFAQLSNELEKERAKSKDLLDRAHSITEIAMTSQQAQAKSTEEHTKTLLHMQSELAQKEAQLEHAAIMTSSYIEQLDASRRANANFHSAASSAAGPDVPIVSDEIAQLDAQMQLLLDGQAKSQAIAAVTSSVEHQAQLRQDATAQHHRDTAAAEAQRSKLLLEQKEKEAAIALELKKNEQQLLAQAEAIRREQQTAMEHCNQVKAAEEAELEAQYNTRKAALNEKHRRNRAAFNLHGIDMPTAYAAATTASPAGTAMPTVHTVPPPHPSAVADKRPKTTFIKSLKLKDWTDAEDRLYLPAWYTQICVYTRKTHANEPDSATWTDIYTLPEKMHGFVVQTIVDKLANVQWAMIKLKALARELGCVQMDLLPLPALLDCLQDACMSYTVGRLTDDTVGAAALLNLQLTATTKQTARRHIEDLEEQFQKAQLELDDILEELDRNNDPEIQKNVDKFTAKIEHREIARHFVKEIQRVDTMKHHVTELFKIADACEDFEAISDLLKDAIQKSSTVHDKVQPDPSTKSTDADDHGLVANEQWISDKRTAKKAKQKAAKDAKQASVAALLASKKEWSTTERALVISMNGKDNTFSRKTDLCASCNSQTCARGVKCTKSKGAQLGYSRWLKSSGTNAEPQKDKRSRERNKSSGNTRESRCFDFKQGKCQRGDSCKYSHDSANNATGGGNSGAELAKLQKRFDEQALKYSKLQAGQQVVTQLLCAKDPEFAQAAQTKLGSTLMERALSFVCEQATDAAADQ